MSEPKGWNKPDSGHNLAPAKKTSQLRVLLFGLIVVLLGGALTWYSFSGKKSAIQVKNKRQSSKIAEVTPAIPKKSTVEVAPPASSNLVKTWDGKLVEWPPKDAYKDKEGVWRHPGGQMCFDPRVKPNFIGTKTRQIFDHVTENQVANLLTAPPGKMYFGTPSLFKSPKFKEDFVQALVSPTEGKEEDTDADKALRADVRAAMKELAERVKGGEDIGEILTETRQELQRLGQYKQNIIKELKESMKGQELTDDDVRDYVAAANKMLEQNGIAPMSVSDIAIRNLRRNVDRMSLKSEESKEE